MAKYNDLRGRALLFLLCLWSLWFISFSLRMLFSPILPLLEDEYLVTHAQASGIFVFLSAGYGVSVMIAGLFSGGFGYKKTILFSLLLLGLICLLIPFLLQFWLLYAFAAALGLLVGFYVPAAIPLITEHYAEKDWGKVLAIHDTGASIAVFATPFIVLFLLRFLSSWRGMFVVYGLVFLASALIFSFACREVKVLSPPRTVFRDLMKRASLWRLSILWMLAVGANLGVYSIVPLYLSKELGLPVGYANSILGISRLGAIGVAVACGFLIDRFNLRRVMFIVLMLTGILTVLMAVVSTRHMGVVLFLQAFCVAGFFPAGLVAIAKTFGRETRSLATGVIIAMSIVNGGGVIPYLLGLMGDLHSFRIGLLVLGIFVSLSSRLVFDLRELE